MKIPIIKKVKALSDFKFLIVFDDGLEGIFSLRKHFSFAREIEKELLKTEIFEKIFVNKNFGHIEWPNGYDISPEYLYDIIKKEKATQTSGQ